jgi:anaerobic selenocysteine-containing dehydrogenase
MQRHAGGGNAMRAVACLPALTGAWRDRAGGALLSSSGAYPVDTARVERPDLIRGGRARSTCRRSATRSNASEPPVRAIFVYNSNPVAVAPESAKVVRGFARDDLFVVVHDLFRTDTADYADLLLPATSQLEHLDVHSSYGHLHVQANNPSIAPLGEALPNTELFRRLAAAMGYDEPCFRESDDDLARRAFRADDSRIAGWDWDAVKRDGFRRLALPDASAPFAQGGFPTPSGRCEFSSASLAAAGHDPLRGSLAARIAGLNPSLAARYPLAFISPPARNFSIPRSPTCRRSWPRSAGRGS